MKVLVSSDPDNSSFVDKLANELANVIIHNPELLVKPEDLEVAIWCRVNEAYQRGKKEGIVLDMSRVTGDNPKGEN